MGPTSSPTTSLYDLGRFTFPLRASAAPSVLGEGCNGKSQRPLRLKLSQGPSSKCEVTQPLICPGRPHSFFHSWWEVYKLWVLPTSLTSPPGPNPAPLTTHTFSALLSPLGAFAPAQSSAWKALPPGVCWAHSSFFRSKATSWHLFLPCPTRWRGPQPKATSSRNPLWSFCPRLSEEASSGPMALVLPSSYTTWISVGVCSHEHLPKHRMFSEGKN